MMELVSINIYGATIVEEGSLGGNKTAPSLLGTFTARATPWKTQEENIEGNPYRVSERTYIIFSPFNKIKDAVYVQEKNSDVHNEVVAATDRGARGSTLRVRSTK